MGLFDKLGGASTERSTASDGSATTAYDEPDRPDVPFRAPAASAFGRVVGGLVDATELGFDDDCVGATVGIDGVQNRVSVVSTATFAEVEVELLVDLSPEDCREFAAQLEAAADEAEGSA